MRTIVADVEFAAIAAGIGRSAIRPGGKDGPNGEMHLRTRWGPGWMSIWVLGNPDNDFQLLGPDIRMPPNQYWPVHWHGCWIAVVLLDGECLIGDWWMQPGDVLVSPAEYGPVLSGKEGCQLFEIFAQRHVSSGGYAPKYRDHPTLQDGAVVCNFFGRTPENERNGVRSSVPLDEEKRLITGTLGTASRWHLGDSWDPERGRLIDTRLAPGVSIASGSCGDWHAIFILDGDATLGDRVLLSRADVLVMQPDALVPELKAGSEGAQLLEVARTLAGESSGEDGDHRRGPRRPIDRGPRR